MLAAGGKPMIRTIIFALLAIIGSGRAVAASADLSQKIDAYVSARAALGHFGGTVLVARDGKPVFEKSVGMADYGRKIPNRNATAYLAASITKQFTAAAILQLRDAEKLSLDDNICRWTKDCPQHWTPVTIKHLLTHTSGIWDYESGLEFGSAPYAAAMARPNHVDALIDLARAKALEFTPGSKYSYSNTGYLLLARVIEKASRERYAAYVGKYLLRPAGMRDSGIADGRPVKALAHGYSGDQELSREQLLKGIPIERFPVTPVSAGDLSGGHGDAALYTTAGDLLRWFTALGAGKIVSKASLAEMQTPVLDDYGYGVQIEGTGAEWTIAHTGVLPGFVSRVEWRPESKLAIIVLSNVDSSRFDKVAADLRRIVDGKPYDIPRSLEVIQLSEAQRKDYLGAYRIAGQPLSIRDEKGMLILGGKQFNAGLIPIGADLFFAPLFEGTVRFARDGSGGLQCATLHFNGEDHAIERDRPSETG